MYQAILEEIQNAGAQLIAVSKTQPADAIRSFYDKGHRDFGENRVQELVEKQKELPEDVRWHMIGHLQRNKVKSIISFVHLIHSIDSVRLLKEVNKQAEIAGRSVPILLQVHIAQESSKHGFHPNEIIETLNRRAEFEHVTIQGLMGMATFTDDLDQVRNEFSSLAKLFQKAKTECDLDHNFKEVSMGMSGDYPIAIEEGSTMVRVGSLLFGKRRY